MLHLVGPVAANVRRQHFALVVWRMRVRPYYLFAAAPYVLYGIPVLATGGRIGHDWPPYLFYLVMAALVSAMCIAIAVLIAGVVYRRRARQNHLPTIALDIGIVAQVIFLAFLAVGSLL